MASSRAALAVGGGLALAAGGIFLILRELREIRLRIALLTSERGDDQLRREEGASGPASDDPMARLSTVGTRGLARRDSHNMTATGIGRMHAVGSILSSLPRAEHNKLVAALSRRAAPVSQWGPDLTNYPDVVEARLCSLQTGDLVLTSTRVGSWVGNTVQVLTHSTKPSHPNPGAARSERL